MGHPTGPGGAFRQFRRRKMTGIRKMAAMEAKVATRVVDRWREEKLVVAVEREWWRLSIV